MGMLCLILITFSSVAAWASRDQVAERLALVMFGSWAGCNLAVVVFGFDQAPVVIPLIDGIAGVCAGMVAVWKRSRLAGAIFGLFVAEGVWHVASYLLGPIFPAIAPGSFMHYRGANVVFILQTVALGGGGGWMAFDRWLHHRPVRDVHPAVVR